MKLKSIFYFQVFSWDGHYENKKIETGEHYIGLEIGTKLVKTDLDLEDNVGEFEFNTRRHQEDKSVERH